MTAGAVARGALGVIISGRCRDLREHRESSFPVFARGHSTLGQSPFTRPSAVNVPLEITSGSDFPPVVVNPGDYVVADEDGVVCVPIDLVQEVVDLATEGREVDSKCMVDIRAGKGVQQTFKTHRGK
jgi:regulator of RNase E activity RraA